MCIFNFSENWKTIFQSGFTILCYHQQCTGIPVAPHPHQLLVWQVFLTIKKSIPKEAKLYAIAALIHISLMTN